MKKRYIPKKLCSILILMAVSSVPFSQQTVLLEDFEANTMWSAELSGEASGFTYELQQRPGAPLWAEGPFPEQFQTLGLKVHADSPGKAVVSILPGEPVALTKGAVQLSLWVHGDNYNHVLYAVILDKDKEPLADVRLGKLNFSGWKEMVTMLSFDVPNEMQLYLGGLKIKFDPLSMEFGNTYYYFDLISCFSYGELLYE